VSETNPDRRVLGIALKSSFLVFAMGAALAFATQILLARLMGATEYGIYYYALSWLTVATLIGQIGFDQSLLRFMPVYIQDGNWPKAKGIMKAGGLLAGYGGLLLAVIMILVVLAMGDKLSDSQRMTFMIAALCLPLRGLIYIRQATLRSFMYTVRSLLPDAVISPAILIILAIGLYHVYGLSSAPSFMMANLIAISLAFLIGAYWKSKLIPSTLKSAEPSYKMRKWLRVAFLLFIINGAHMLLGNVDVLILGIFRHSSDVGIYGISSRIASVVTFTLIAMYPVFAPLIAKHQAAGRREELQQAIAHGMRPVVLIAGFLSLILIVWGPEILGLFGVEFERGSVTLALLVGGQFVNALCGPVALLLAYGGHEPLAAKVLVAVLIVSVCLHFLVIPSFGMEGAAVVTAASVAIWNLALFVLARRHLHVDPSGWFPIKG
jgi:O-antigen/teichoic acid export membrane protein